MREVHDFDITFASGFMVPISLDYASGESIDIQDEKIVIHRVARSILAHENHDPVRETVTIYRSHILMIQERTRQVRELSAEEEATLKQSIAGGVMFNGVPDISDSTQH